MERICQYCKGILGCPHLAGPAGRFLPDMVITVEEYRECRDFEEIGDREKEGVRERLYRLSGLGYLRTLHELPGIVMDGLRQGEKDELMYEEIPDFQDPKLLYEGMPVSEREEVLRYETDENGNVIVEQDDEGAEVKRARPTYHLKQYAIDEDGPVRLDQSVAWFWTTNQLIDHILKVETDAGILFKEKKSRAAKDRATPKPPPATQERETDTMAETGKRVRVTRSGANKPAASTAARTSAGPRRVSPKKPDETPAASSSVRVARVARGAAAKPAEAEAAAAAEDTGADGVVAAVESVVSKIVMDEVGELKAEIKELKSQLVELRNTFIDAITIFHDIMAQTGGTLQYPAEDEEGNDVFDENGNQVMESGPELFPKDSKIFAYLDGTAFDPDAGTSGEG
jgi:hypothetical protein